MPCKITIVSTGNVAFHLTKKLHSSGEAQLSTISRSPEKGQQFCKALDLQIPHSQKNDPEWKADFVILAVPDKEIPNVLKRHTFHLDTILLHTSGAVDIEVFEAHPQYGALYPFQTFTKTRSIDFDHIPILIEGNNEMVEDKIVELAKLLGPKIFRMTSPERLKIHLAAVFASNFTNNLFQITEKLLDDSGMKLSDFSHLIQETVDKAFELSPKDAQTGPAIRNDEKVMEKHLSLLIDEDLKELYRLHSKLIQNH